MGWLGWTPETVETAHMMDVITAYEGRVEMLQGLFGGGDKTRTETSAPKDSRPLATKWREAMQFFGARRAGR